MKKKGLIIALAVVLAVAVVVALILWRRKKKKEKSTNSGSYVAANNKQTVDNVVKQTVDNAVNSNVLKKGSRGEDVKQLQTILISKGYQCGNIDGIFGNKTENALKEATGKTLIAVDEFDTILSADEKKNSNPNLKGNSAAWTTDTALYYAIWIHDNCEAWTSKDDLKEILRILGEMKTKSDYTSLNNAYQNKYGKSIISKLKHEFSESQYAKDVAPLIRGVGGNPEI